MYGMMIGRKNEKDRKPEGRNYERQTKQRREQIIRQVARSRAGYYVVSRICITIRNKHKGLR